MVVGPPAAAASEAVDVDALLRQALRAGSVKGAEAKVIAMTGLPRKQVYARALKVSSDQAGSQNKPRKNEMAAAETPAILLVV